MVTTLNLGIIYKFPLIRVVTSTLLLNEVNKFITSRDGKGVVHNELHNPDLTNNKAIFPLYLDQEKLLLNFIDYRIDNCPKYEVYNYNCASFVKEAFCAVYTLECDSFKEIVINQIYENPTMSNLAAVAFLNTIGALD